MATIMTLDEARARFGELLDPTSRTYSSFSEGEWIWRPAHAPGTRETVYRRYPGPRATAGRPTYRPKGTRG